jgi:hypothetical protein
MARARVVLALAVILAAMGPFAVAGDAAGVGALQVTCWPGHRVYLDDRFVRPTTAAEDGLYLQDVAAGEHVIRVEKLGFEAASFDISVPAGGVAEIQVGELVPLGQESWRELRAMPTSPELQPSPRPVKPMPPIEGRVAENPRSAPPAPSDLQSESPPIAGDAESPELVAPETVEPNSVSPTPEEDLVPSDVESAAPAEPAVLASGAAELPAEESSPVAPEVPRGDEFDLRRQTPTASDVLFAYRAKGSSLADGGKVTVFRERGGPRAPVMVFWCVDQIQCRNQSQPIFSPGSYRFRINCRRGDGPTATDADVFLDVEAMSGGSYLVDTVFDDGCRASVVELSRPEAGPTAR